MLAINYKDILRITTFFIESADENIAVEIVTVGNWLQLRFDERSRNDGVYLLRLMLDEKDMFIRGGRSDALVDKIMQSCRTIYSLLLPDLSASVVDLLVKICRVKYNNNVPEDIIDALRQLATLIAGGYSANDYLSGREQHQPNTIAEDVYTVLEISSSATDEEVMRAFRKLSLKYHPDRMVNATEEEKEWASRKLQAVVEAKNIIMDHRKQNRP